MKQMSDIYSGALVVIVAAWAKSPSGSLLSIKPQSGQSYTWRTASLIRYEEMDLDVKFRKRLWETHRSTYATYCTPIAERAWYFQEKLLASRCLVFVEDEVVWEYRSCCLCECIGAQENFSVGRTWPKPYQQMLLPLAEQDTLRAFAQLPFTEHEPFLDGTLTAFAQLPFAEHEPFQLDGPLKYFAVAEAAYSFWESAVLHYSGRKLTFQTDRLPAISAVASIIADATGDRYLAGLWRNDLVAGLTWVALAYTKAAPHQEYIAPTWSWASLPVEARYYLGRTRRSRDADLEASVVDAWTHVKDFGRSGRLYGPMSEVTDGAIVLSGVHCDVEMTISKYGRIQLDFGDGEVETVCAIGDLSAQSLDFMPVEPDTDTNVDRLGGNVRYLRRSGTDQQTRGQLACSGTVHLLWLKKDTSLILTPSQRRKGAYERLGIFHPAVTLGPYYGINAPKMPKGVQRSEIELV